MPSSDDNLNRRTFLKLAGRAGASVAACGGLGYWLHHREASVIARETEGGPKDYRAAPGRPAMVIAKGSSPEQITKAVIDELGGMRRFISQGDIVAIKPNIGWDRVPEQAANTNPEVVRTVAELCYDAGAKRVIVTDKSCNDPRRTFQRSGIAAAARSVGADVPLPEERRFREYSIRGEMLDIWPVYTPFLEADKVINIPIVKHHNLARATIGMKNWYGLLSGRRNQLHQRIDVSIADLATFMRPTLVVMDAVRILVTNGPQGGNISDVRRMDIVAAGTDQVALDAYGVSLLGLDPEEVGYIRIGHERGLGTMRYETLHPIRLNLGDTT